MPTNQTRRQLLERIKTSSFPGSIIDVFKAADQGVDLISQFEQQQQQEQAQQQMQQEQMQQDQGMQVANTPEEQEIGLREQHAMGNTDASMAFPNVQPGQSFNTVGMKAPIDIQKIDSQGHLVESYKNVPPGIQDLPTGPYEGTIIESPAAYQKGGVRKYQKAGKHLKEVTLQKEDDVYQGMNNIYAGANFMRRWQLSDRYNDLVTKEIKKDQKGNGPFSDWSVEKFNRYRNANLMSNGTFDYSFDISSKDNNNMISASTDPTTGKITFYRPRTEEGIQFVGKIPTLGSTMAHEKTHQRDRGFFKPKIKSQEGSVLSGLMSRTMLGNTVFDSSNKDFKIPFLVPQSSVNLIDKYLTLNKDFDEGQKVPGNMFGIPLESADPTKYFYLTNKNIRYDEIVARLNAIRHEVDKYGLFDVFNEEVTEENYNLILEHFEKFGDKSNGLFGEYGKSGSSLRDLQQLFQDKQIRDLLNKVSDKGDPSGVDFIGEDLNENTKVVKKGGIRKMQYGGVPLKNTTGMPLANDVSGELQSIGSPGMIKAAIGNTLAFNPNHQGIRRMIAPTDNSYLFPDGRTGTHYIGSFGNIVIPEIQNVDGELKFTGPTNNPNEYIKFHGPLAKENARYFAENYKDVAPAFQKRGGIRKYQDGGTTETEGYFDEWGIFHPNNTSTMGNTSSNNMYDNMNWGFGWNTQGNPGLGIKTPFGSLNTSGYPTNWKEAGNKILGAFGGMYGAGKKLIPGVQNLETAGLGKLKNVALGLSDTVGGWFNQKGGLRKYQNGGGGEISEDNQSVLNWFEDYKKGEYFNTITGNYPSLSFEGQDYTPQALEQITEFGTKGQNQWNSTNLLQNPSQYGAYYHKGKINMPPGMRSSVLAHELGHTDNNWLSLPFQNWVGDHNLKLQSGDIQEGSHDAQAHETRGDLIRLRYMMQNANIFNSTGDFKTFTAEDYDKAYGQFGKLKSTDSRIFRMYNKEDVIWLMNNMANKTPQGGNSFEITDDLGGESQYMSKKGGLRKYQFGGEKGFGLKASALYDRTLGGNTGINASFSPSYRFLTPNLDIGAIRGTRGWGDDRTIFTGGNMDLRFGPSRSTVGFRNEGSTRFMGSLQGELGHGYKASPVDMFSSARRIDPDLGQHTDPPADVPTESGGRNWNINWPSIKFPQGVDASGRLSLGIGRPGEPGCEPNHCGGFSGGTTPWNLSGFYEAGTKNSLRPGQHVGLSGRLGNLSGEYNYNLDTKQHGFQAGLKIPLFNNRGFIKPHSGGRSGWKKGGVRKLNKRKRWL